MLDDVRWSPSPASSAAMRRWIEASGSSDFAEAHSASVGDLDSFWSWAWDDSAVVGEVGEQAFEPGAGFLDARFFPQDRLNVVDGALEPLASLLLLWFLPVLVGIFAAMSSIGLTFANSTALGIAASSVGAGSESAWPGRQGISARTAGSRS
jgi:hypothetical protein